MQVRKGLQQAHFFTTRTLTQRSSAVLALAGLRPGRQQDQKLAAGAEAYLDLTFLFSWIFFCPPQCFLYCDICMMFFICNSILFPGLVFAGMHWQMAEAKPQGPTVAPSPWLMGVCKASGREDTRLDEKGLSLDR